MRAAAIQMQPVIADVAANLAAAERLADKAAVQGAELIVLPEFFTTGAAFRPDLADAALAPDGVATELLQSLALRHGAILGGSFLCRDPDGHVRNAFILVNPDGTVAGRHDKDIPTMWENALYIGGHDDGIIKTPGLRVGAAVCWEFMRAQTARRLRGKVDIVVGGSFWWSVPHWRPHRLFDKLERSNARTAALAAPHFAKLVGAPVIHAAHAGTLSGPMPWMPGLPYQGTLQGGATISDARGHVLDRRTPSEGEGIAIADVIPEPRDPSDEIPDKYWLHPRGSIAAAAWHYQRIHGQRWYKRHVQGHSPSDLRTTIRDDLV